MIDTDAPLVVPLEPGTPIYYWPTRVIVTCLPCGAMFAVVPKHDRDALLHAIAPHGYGCPL